LITLQKQLVRGTETLVVVLEDDKPVGYVTKFRDDRYTRNPWKAYRYKGPFVPGQTEAHFLGVTYDRKKGQDKAVNAVVSGQHLPDDYP
jgi:hypothetical protein